MWTHHHCSYFLSFASSLHLRATCLSSLTADLIITSSTDMIAAHEHARTAQPSLPTKGAACTAVCGACAWILWDGRQWCCQAGKWGWQSGRRSWAYMGEGAKGMDDPWMLGKYGAGWGAACERCRDRHAWKGADSADEDEVLGTRDTRIRAQAYMDE